MGAAPSRFTSGQILGNRYRIAALLGRGGMGEVWQAYDLKLQVDVALKSIRPERFPGAQGLDLLRREVRAAREVMSPNVCRIFDLVDEEGQEFVSMEYVDGETLLELLKSRGPLELQEATRIASQFLAGLEAIHQADLVHRDVKPENIMITRTGRVVLMDFGVAKGVAEDHRGTIAGTPAYMAPEQSRGEALDARADIFAAGVVLAEMIAPQGVREHKSRESIWSLVRQTPVRLFESPWRAALERAVASERSERYGSARELARALETVTLRVEGAEDKRPYPGLAPFREQDAEYFFGREAEVEALWKRLQRTHLLGVIGPSGAGKSSFLHAGLVPAIPEGWRQITCHPGPRPYMALGRALAVELAGDPEAVQELLRLEERGVATSLFKRWREHHGEALLIVDQFEELFTLNPPEVQERFARLLGNLAVEAEIHVLLSMRDDFLFHCHAHPMLSPIFAELTPLGPPSGSALRRALVQPALLCGYRFESEALADEMLSVLTDERGALPLMAFAMSRLWEHRDREHGVLTREAYERIGGVSGALAQHAETTLEQLGSTRQPLVREIFRNLVTSQGTRAAIETEELLSAFNDRATAESVLRELVESRLLTTFEIEGDEGQSGRRVEIAHESLMTRWPRLVRWQTQDADGAQFRDQLRQQARLWDERERPEDLLWTGTSYREFNVWQERYAGGLTATEDAYAQAMTARAERARRRRRWMTAGAFASVVAVAAVVLVLWIRAEGANRRSEAGRLLALGRLELERNPSGALAYATASLELVDDPVARRFALGILWRGPTALVRPGTPGYWGGMGECYFSPDGRWLADADNRFLQTKVTRLSFEDGSRRTVEGYPLGFSSDSNMLATSVIVMKADVEGEAEEALVRLVSLPECEVVRRFAPIRPYRHLIGRRTTEDGRLITSSIDAPGITPVWYSWPFGGGDPELLGPYGQPYSPIVLPSLDPTGTWGAHGLDRDLYVFRLGDPQAEVIHLGTQAARMEFGPSMHPNGEYVASTDVAGNIYLWSRLRPGAPLRVIPSPGYHKIIASFDPSGTRLVVTDGGGSRLYLWDLEGPPEAEPLVLGPMRVGEYFATFHPRGHWLVARGGAEPTFWPLARRYPHVLRGHSNSVTDVAFAPDGSWLASCSIDGTVRVWSLSPQSQQQSRLLFRPGELNANLMLYAVAVIPDGSAVIVGGGTSVAWVISTLEEKSTELTAAHDGVSSIAVGPRGRKVALGSRGTSEVRVWDLETRTYEVVDAKDGNGLGPHCLRFLPDGRLLAATRSGLRLWNLEDRTHELLSSVPAAAISTTPDGNRVVCWVKDEAGAYTRVYDRRTKEWRSLPTHTSKVGGASGSGWGTAIDPSGTIVATRVQRTGEILVGPITGEEPHMLLGHEGSVLGLAFDPKGRYLATSGSDGTVRLWPVPEGTPLHTLPHDDLIEKLRTLTNLRVVRKDSLETGYGLEVGPFPGWRDVPTW